MMKEISIKIEPKAVGKNILIIDDDIFLLDMYSLRLTQAGFNVHTAMSAPEVLTKLRGGFKPDVILMDVVMPAITGFELLEQMNNEKLAVDTLKIFLSNLSQDQDFEKGTSLGAKGYIVKANNTPSEVVAYVLDTMEKNGL